MSKSRLFSLAAAHEIEISTHRGLQDFVYAYAPPGKTFAKTGGLHTYFLAATPIDWRETYREFQSLLPLEVCEDPDCHVCYEGDES